MKCLPLTSSILYIWPDSDGVINEIILKQRPLLFNKRRTWETCQDTKHFVKKEAHIPKRKHQTICFPPVKQYNNKKVCKVKGNIYTMLKVKMRLVATPNILKVDVVKTPHLHHCPKNLKQTPRFDKGNQCFYMPPKSNCDDYQHKTSAPWLLI